LPDQLFFDIVKMVVALAFILGLAYGAVYLLKRLLPGVARAGVERVDLFVVSQLSVGTRQKVCVVRVHDRTLVLGVTEGSITTLAELAPPAAADAKKEADDPKIFAELLSWHKDSGAQAGPRAESAHGKPAAAAPFAAAVNSADHGADRGDGPQLFAPGKRPQR
jgi:flagellar biosynthetic protein FliO